MILGQRLGAGGVDERQPLQAEDHHLDPVHLPEPLEEPGHRPEEEGAVESEDGDVVGEQRVLVDRAVVVVGQVLLGRARARWRWPGGPGPRPRRGRPRWR